VSDALADPRKELEGEFNISVLNTVSCWIEPWELAWVADLCAKRDLNRDQHSEYRNVMDEHFEEAQDSVFDPAPCIFGDDLEDWMTYPMDTDKMVAAITDAWNHAKGLND
jgi:hypothetical protein